MEFKQSYYECVYPKKQKAFKKKLASFILLISLIIAAVVYMVVIIVHSANALLIVFLCVFIFLIGFLLAFFVPSIIKEFRKTAIIPFYGIDILGKLYMDNKRIILFLGKRIVKEINWQDVALIEKFSEFNENRLIILTPDYRGKAIKDSKYFNYIEIPARISLENAIKHYSGKEITLRKEEL